MSGPFGFDQGQFWRMCWIGNETPRNGSRVRLDFPTFGKSMWPQNGNSHSPRAGHDTAVHRPVKGSRHFWFGMHMQNEFNTVRCVEGIDIRSKTSYLHVFDTESSMDLSDSHLSISITLKWSIGGPNSFVLHSRMTFLNLKQWGRDSYYIRGRNIMRFAKDMWSRSDEW